MAQVIVAVFAVAVIFAAVFALPHPQDIGSSSTTPPPGSNTNNQAVVQNCQSYLIACQNQTTQIQNQQNNQLPNNTIQGMQNNTQMQGTQWESCNQNQTVYCQQITNTTQINNQQITNNFVNFNGTPIPTFPQGLPNNSIFPSPIGR